MNTFPAAENDLTKASATVKLEHVFMMEPVDGAWVHRCRYCGVAQSNDILLQQCPGRQAELDKFNEALQHRGLKP